MTKEIANSAYGKVIEPFSDKELHSIAQMKRFFEWVQGDPDFRHHVDSGNITPEYRARLKRIGVLFDLSEIDLLWKSPDIAENYLIKISQLAYDFQYSITPEDIAIVKQYPLLELWARFSIRLKTLHRRWCKSINPISQNPSFHAWRMRRIASTRSELGFFGYIIDHPILAFELGDGCSIGCWFCAFAARKLTNNYDYNENRESFSRIIHSCVDLFGRNHASLALLYYGTEPHDNPHYLDFVRDYEAITGRTVCTSTAVGTDVKWMREMLAYYRKDLHPWPRLSVLSKEQMYKIHDSFTPDELRDVELLMQTRDHPRGKVSGGRILKEESGLRDRHAGHYLETIVPQGSIACISGFLVNLVNQTIQLVSPCYTCKQWPYGYRVFDKITFTSASDFKAAVEKLIARNMPDSPFPQKRIRWRDDLDYRPAEDGLDLVSPNQVHHLKGKQVYEPLGQLITEARLTYQELYNIMTSEYQVNPMVVVSVVQKLFNEGFLDEINQDNGHMR